LSPFSAEDFVLKESKKDESMANKTLVKCPTGIQGLDEITGGGLPRGRPTLVCGSAGCGKTVMGMEFLVRGAMQFGEPGVFLAFEEGLTELTTNFASLGFDLNDLVARKKIALDHVYVERSEIEEAGAYDLEGLFIRLGYAIDSIGAKRVVLDTIETLFAGFTQETVLRAELRRLFRWLKDKGVTAVITGERGERSLTRHGLEEYVADCVILLDHRIQEQLATRRLRIVKYRGSQHGIDEYPFLIDQQGLSILPITSLGLNHPAVTEKVSLGLERLDDILGGGCYRGSSLLVSGTAGTGKSSLAACFVDAACRRGERALYFAFEESPQQIKRNMRSIGLDLEPWVREGLLQFQAARPTLNGLEMHLAIIHRAINEHNPQVVVVDPISNLVVAGNLPEVKAMMTRLIDFLKMQQITGMFTNLTIGGSNLEQTFLGVSSLMDTWIVLKDVESQGERNRALQILKSRGMAHSNQVWEFLLTDRGIEIVDVALMAQGMMGAARQRREAEEKAQALIRQQALAAKQRGLEQRRAALEAKIAALRADFDAEASEMQELLLQEQRRQEVLMQEQQNLVRLVKADPQQKGD
jgi:circadian clock protein KaiC